MPKHLMLGLFFAACAALHVYAKITQPDPEGPGARSHMQPMPQPNDHDDLDDPNDGDE